MDSATGQLTVRRDSPGDIKQREVLMSLDGERIGTVFFGQALRREVPAGTHRLRAYNTLVWKTVEFHIEPGARIEFLVTNYAKAGFWAFATLFGFAPLYVKLEQTDPKA